MRPKPVQDRCGKELRDRIVGRFIMRPERFEKDVLIEERKLFCDSSLIDVKSSKPPEGSKDFLI